jgi:hypothetical protein
MPRPGFYNDNEYRAYPFVFSAAQQAGLPDSIIVDAGVIMRLDCAFDDTLHTVWLQKITREADKFYFTFKTDAHDEVLVFSRDATAAEWQIEYVESAAQTAINGEAICEENQDPVWEGFLVTGPLADLDAMLQVDGDIVFEKDVEQLEPGRIQNLNKAYARSISVGNYERPNIPECGDPLTNITPNIVLNKQCLQGNIKFKDGYNCSIRQTAWNNEIRIGAAIGAGAKVDEELCANGSELALFAGEAAAGKFFGNGPACDDLIFTINGLGGPTVTITGGQGINIATQTDPPRITISKDISAAGNCPQTQS